MKRTSCQRKESLTREWHEASDIYAKAVANAPLASERYRSLEKPNARVSAAWKGKAIAYKTVLGGL